ncbi:MAG: sugar ABC transporter permease [Chloroflexi bacterium RBG_16_72_14]|nr:MAG: sugar ABC transporter permease [Chloroflexi bacterium RBG_16_72_14]
MADATPVSGQVQPPSRASIRGLIAQTEIDLRLFGMLVALAAILLTFNILSGGTLFQPTNMVTLAVQAAGVAVIATGMVLVIVSRNIDLSVGSLVGLIAMTYALLMTDWMPMLGMGADFPFRWVIALGLGVGLGALVGGLQGYIIAYIGVPSFIVTLGGLLSIRGVVWYLSSGAAVSGLDPNFQLIGGGAQGSIGGTLTWILGLVGCLAIVALLINGRRQRRRFGFPVRPMWAEVLIGVVGCAAVLGVAAFANANLWPEGLANRIATEQNWGPTPEGGWRIPTGFPNPIMLLIGVTLAMTWMANRRRFGRYVYAYGGNPDAAELAGINTRWTILKTYVVMGVLCALAAAIASARLNGATLDVGQSYELYVIAAAVVGGTSFAGGIGTIPGAVLGAFVMQSLAYGLSFMGVNSPGQNVVAGIVLIVAVGFDTFNRRRGS